MDRTRGLSVDMACHPCQRNILVGKRTYAPWKSTGNREPGYYISQASSIAVILSRVELLKRALKPQRCKGGWGTMTRSYNVDHIEVVIPNQ